MPSPTVPRNAYTDAPEQHPNLILGSLQLLFWLFFRPSAFRNHIARIDTALHSEPDSANRSLWETLDWWRFLIQAYLILPVLVNLPLFFVQRVLAESKENIAFCVEFDVLLGAVFSVTLGARSIKALGVMFILAISLLFTLARGVTPDLVVTVIWDIVIGVVFILTPNLAVISVAVSVLFMVYGGVLYVTDDGSGTNAKNGKNILRNAAISLIVSLIAGSIVAVARGLLGGAVPNFVPVVVFGVGLTLNLWRPVVLYPFLTVWNTLLYQLDKRRTATKPSLLRWNSAFWDEWQRLPLHGLDKHVVLVMERNPAEGKAAVNYLSTSRQRWAAQERQIELDAKELERCADVEAISKVHESLAVGDLESTASALLRSFSHLSENVDAALNQRTAYNQRLALSTVAESLLGLIRELTRSSDKYAVRFLPIARSWHQIVSDYVQELAETVELRQEIDNPYIIGVPLTEQLEIFTGRTNISLRIEQLLLDRRRPPLLLYGQRRMGKTSLLNNLGRLLPNTIILMFVDLQGTPAAASDHAGFLYNLAKGMVNSAQRQSRLTLPSLTREALAIDPFTCFDEWLDKVEQVLEQNTALLALDEFEVLDSAIAKGRFDEQDVLGMLRHLIQHRPRFKVLLSGSHTLEEYQRCTRGERGLRVSVRKSSDDFGAIAPSTPSQCASSSAEPPPKYSRINSCAAAELIFRNTSTISLTISAVGSLTSLTQR